MNNEGYAKPLKTKTPNTPSEIADGKQMTG